MTSKVNSDFKCVWRPLELCRAQCAQLGPLGLQDSWVLGQGQALESVFLFEGQMKQPQNEEQMKKQDIWAR